MPTILDPMTHETSVVLGIVLGIIMCLVLLARMWWWRVKLLDDAAYEELLREIEDVIG